MLDIEKEISIMKRRILALEQTIDELNDSIKQKDMKIESLERRLSNIEFGHTPIC